MSQTDTAWPIGHGEMAGRIRGHDWVTTPLGSAAIWPASLKIIVNLLLSSGFPTIALWGRELIQIYNDGYRDLMGIKHPAGLGQPTRECWPEVWHINLSIYDRVWAGETVNFEDARYPITRSGVLQDAWFTLSYSPLWDAEGLVAGILVVLFETTVQHLVEEQRTKAEASLAASETRHRLLVESWAQAVWETNADGVVVTDSPSWRVYTGQTLEEWLGYGWLDAIHPEDRSYAGQQWQDAVAACSLVDADFRLRAPNGGWRWTNVRAAPVLDAAGHVEKWVGMNIDIDERKRTEAEVLRLREEIAQAQIREGEERFRQFGEASQDVLWIRDAETMQWQYLTPAFETIYGVGRDEALSGDNYHSWLDLIVPEDRRLATEMIKRVRDGECVTFEYRIKRPADGSIRWLRNSDFPILNSEGEVSLIGGIGHDLTELRVAQYRLEALVENIPQLVWRADDAGHWTWASPQWTKFTGQLEADSRGWGWLAPVHPDDREVIRAAWARAEAEGQFAAECRIRESSTGVYRWFQTRATPLRDERGAIVEWFGTSTDINDLRRLQEHQQVLVKELQHRTFNLMGMVQSTANLTLRSSVDLDDFKVKFSDRVGALARVQRLLSRLQDDERVTFGDLIYAELDATGALDSDKQRVTLEGPRDVPLRSSTVQTFAMALHELTTNAVKYGALSQAGARLHVRWWVEEGEEGRPWLHVDWCETGVTMPSKDAPAGGTGQGRTLIEKALPYQLQAKTSYFMAEDGVRCSIALPASSRSKAEVHGAAHGSSNSNL